MIIQKDGQEAGALPLSTKNDISKYAQQYIKSRMDTDQQLGKSSVSQPLQALGEMILDGSKEEDYDKSFRSLVEMIDRALDDYKGDLQQILFPMFTILYLTMIRRGFET